MISTRIFVINNNHFNRENFYSWSYFLLRDLSNWRFFLLKISINSWFLPWIIQRIAFVKGSVPRTSARTPVSAICTLDRITGFYLRPKGSMILPHIHVPTLKFKLHHCTDLPVGALSNIFTQWLPSVHG